MPFDPERGIHVFNKHSQLFLSKDGVSAVVYDIPPGQTLRQFREEGSLYIDPTLEDHPVMDRPTLGMSIAFNGADSFYAPTHGLDTLESHLQALKNSFRHRRGRLGLTEVAGGMVLGAPETAAALLMHYEKTGVHLPSGSLRQWVLADMFAGIPYAAGIAKIGGWKSEKLSMKPYPDLKKKQDLVGAAIFIIPESALPSAI